LKLLILILILTQPRQRELFQLVDLLLDRVDLDITQDGVTGLPGGDGDS
jgi:hypothetical protein